MKPASDTSTPSAGGTLLGAAPAQPAVKKPNDGPHAAEKSEIDVLVAGRHGNPFGLLGPHLVETTTGHDLVVRVFIA
ncbi:MAG: hypothetical protein ACRC1K_01055, partial [Planctomycetia bacterium]